jgi:hypothetical protein
MFAEQAIDARAADAEPTGNRRRAESLFPAKPENLAGISNRSTRSRSIGGRSVISDISAKPGTPISLFSEFDSHLLRRP